MARAADEQAPVKKQEKEAAPYDPWKDMRRVYVPKRSRTEQKTLEVGVNDKTYFVPKEKFVEVPMPVWEAINEMLDRQKIMEQEAEKDAGEREFALST